MTTSEWSQPRAGLLMKLRLLLLPLPLPPAPLLAVPAAAPAELDDCISLTAGKGSGGGGGGGGAARLAGLLLDPWLPLFVEEECESQAMMNSPPSTQWRSRTGASRVP